jgi:hypothetical protein
MEPIKITVKADTLVIIRMQLTSRVMAPVVIQPKFENWVLEDGTVLPQDFKVTPAYAFLQTGAESKITYTFKAPNLPQGTKLFGAISIPSAETYLFPVHLEINNEAMLGGGVCDIGFSTVIPPEIKADTDTNSYLSSKETLKFIAGLASLEVIPSKWLVAELLVELCTSGFEFSKTPEGIELNEKLRKTRLFKNGALMFRAAQIPQWVNLANSITGGLQNLTKRDQDQGGMLTGWEIWLYNLIHQDIESPNFKHNEVVMPNTAKTNAVLEVMELDPEKWFQNFILGLYKTSPRIHELLGQVFENVELPKKETIIEVIMPKNVLDEKGSLQR